MTILNWTDPTGAVQRPHVGERIFAGAAVLGMVKQRDSGRVSAAGDAR